MDNDQWKNLLWSFAIHHYQLSDQLEIELLNYINKTKKIYNLIIYLPRVSESAMICKSNRLTLKCNDVSIISYRANSSLVCC